MGLYADKRRRTVKQEILSNPMLNSLDIANGVYVTTILKKPSRRARNDGKDATFLAEVPCAMTWRSKGKTDGAKHFMDFAIFAANISTSPFP